MASPRTEAQAEPSATARSTSYPQTQSYMALGTSASSRTRARRATAATVADPPAASHSPSDPDAGAPGGAAGSAPAYPGPPRWVKASGIAVLVLVVLVVALMVAAGGEHGPGRHLPSGGAVTTHRP